MPKPCWKRGGWEEDREGAELERRAGGGGVRDTLREGQGASAGSRRGVARKVQWGGRGSGQWSTGRRRPPETCKGEKEDRGEQTLSPCCREHGRPSLWQHCTVPFPCLPGSQESSKPTWPVPEGPAAFQGLVTATPSLDLSDGERRLFGSPPASSPTSRLSFRVPQHRRGVSSSALSAPCAPCASVHSRRRTLGRLIRCRFLGFGRTSETCRLIFHNGSRGRCQGQSGP